MTTSGAGESSSSTSAANTSVIVAGARTPVGRLMGSLSGFSGSELGGIAIKAALAKAGVSGDQVQYVIMGQVLTAGAGQIPARQAAVAGGIAMSVPALTINKVCLSGIDAIVLADQLIRAGSFDVVVAGGQESMTRAPHMLEKSRSGFKYGDVTLRDHLAYDGLHDIFTDQTMGALTDDGNTLTREEQDEFAASFASARGSGLEERTLRRRGRCGVHTPTHRRSGGVRPGRRRTRGHHRRIPLGSAASFLHNRHHHRGQRLIDK